MVPGVVAYTQLVEPFPDGNARGNPGQPAVPQYRAEPDSWIDRDEAAQSWRKNNRRHLQWQHANADFPERRVEELESPTSSGSTGVERQRRQAVNLCQ